MIQIASKSFHPIHRLNGSSSQQPRFNEVNPQQFFNSLLRFTNESIHNEPDYGDRFRDEWLRRIWPQEPYLSGVINSVVNIDKNRGWTITGGRNQVKRFVDILHNQYHYAPDLSGWRVSFGGQSLAYWTADIGSVTEIGRLDNEQGPLDSLYFVDPARCRLTGSFDTPLEYKPNSKGDSVPFGRNDYFRIVSLPSTDESLYGLGLSALSRCIELAKIMIGIYQYDNEMLLNRAPRGLLLLKGITQEQWEDAMQVREAKLDGDRKEYYGAVKVLASLDPGIELEAQLVSLSSLPAEFDQQTFTDLLMYGYALCFGYDPREFWPVSAGALGTATETEAQHRKAGAKGGLDFVLSYAEKLNEEIPDTLLFEFEERDLDGELANALTQQAQADVITSMYESGLKEDQPLILREEGRILAAEQGLIDSDWTLEQEDTVATDEGEERSILQHERIQRAAYKFPDEDIVQYRYTIENGREIGRYKLLQKPKPKRRLFIINRQLSYREQITSLANQAENDDISQDDFTERLDALTIAALVDATVRGYDDNNEARQLLQDAATLILEDSSQEAINTGLDVLTDSVILEDAFEPFVIDRLDTRVNLALDSSFADDIYGGLAAGTIANRLDIWDNTINNMHSVGRVAGNPTREYQWNVGQVEKSCGDCAGFDGQIKTGQQWAGGLLPQDPGLECGGFRCQCSLDEV